MLIKLMGNLHCLLTSSYIISFSCYRPPKYTNPTYHVQTDEADLGDTTEDDNANGRAENSPLADDIEATEM